MSKKVEDKKKPELTFEQKNRQEKLKLGYTKLTEAEKILMDTGPDDHKDFARHIRDLKAHIIARIKDQ